MLLRHSVRDNRGKIPTLLVRTFPIPYVWIVLRLGSKFRFRQVVFLGSKVCKNQEDEDRGELRKTGS